MHRTALTRKQAKQGEKPLENVLVLFIVLHCFSPMYFREHHDITIVLFGYFYKCSKQNISTIENN